MRLLPFLVSSELASVGVSGCIQARFDGSDVVIPSPLLSVIGHWTREMDNEVGAFPERVLDMSATEQAFPDHRRISFGDEIGVKGGHS